MQLVKLHPELNILSSVEMTFIKGGATENESESKEDKDDIISGDYLEE